ncbi:hypothetical protein ES703_16197 [subsurface metagenome]
MFQQLLRNSSGYTVLSKHRAKGLSQVVKFKVTQINLFTYLVPSVLVETVNESEIGRKLSRNIYYFANKCYLFGLDLGKICICGDKMESRISKNSDVLQLAKIEPFVARKLTSIEMNRNIQIKAEFI